MEFLRKNRFYVVAIIALLITIIYTKLMLYVRFLIDSQYTNRELERMALYNNYQGILLIKISAVLIPTLLISLIARWLGYKKIVVFIIIFLAEVFLWFGRDFINY